VAGLSVCSAGKATGCAVWYGLRPRNPDVIALGGPRHPETLIPNPGTGQALASGSGSFTAATTRLSSTTK
jgi:hypothetical protein